MIFFNLTLVFNFLEEKEKVFEKTSSLNNLSTSNGKRLFIKLKKIMFYLFICFLYRPFLAKHLGKKIMIFKLLLAKQPTFKKHNL